MQRYHQRPLHRQEEAKAEKRSAVPTKRESEAVEAVVGAEGAAVAVSAGVEASATRITCVPQKVVHAGHFLIV